MIVTHHMADRDHRCSNCGNVIRKGQDMLTAREGSHVVNAHAPGTCPVYPPAHLSPVLRIAGVK